MKFSSVCLLAVLASPVCAFAPVSSKPSQLSSSSSSTLFISSWGKGSGASEFNANDVPQSPEENIQAYLAKPEPVEARANLSGNVLVSGWKDATLFNFLNSEDSAFEFDKIVAFSQDIVKAKKSLLSREARYTGLLDKLDYLEDEGASALPTVEQLEGMTSWVAVVEEASKIEEIAALCKAADSVKNLSILLIDAIDLSSDTSEAVLEGLGACDTDYSLVSVGTLHEDHEEGKVPCKYEEFGGSLAAGSVFSTNEAMRMVTECLQLESAVGKAYTLSEIEDSDSLDFKLVKGLREAGYARPQEVDHMIRFGTSAYQEAIEAYKEKNPGDGVTTTHAWWEDENFQKSVKESSLRKEELLAANREREERLANEQQEA